MQGLVQAAVIAVVGIDTEVGKTIVTGLCARELAAAGRRVITQKLVQTGCTGISMDIQQHRALQGIPLLPEDKAGLTCRYVYPYPCSPHMAADLADERINSQLIIQDTQSLLKSYDLVLLEAAGGLAVPLTQEMTILDYLQEQGYPVILVSSAKLGSINHTVLSLQACAAARIPVLRLVYNRYPKHDPLIAQYTEDYFQRYLLQHSPDTQFHVLDRVGIS